MSRRGSPPTRSWTRAGSRQAPAETFRLYDPPEFAALKAVDARLFAAGMPNALDLPLV